MKNIGKILATILIVGTAVLGACSLFEKPDNGLYSLEEKESQRLEIYTPQVPQNILSLLPEGATNIEVIDSYNGYPDDCWIQFTLNKRWFIFGVHYQSSDRFGTCITQINY